MFVILFIFLLAVLYYIKFRYSRNFLYAFSKTLPTVGYLPILGHTHWFIGGPERILNNIRHLVKKIEETGTVNSVWIGPSLYVVTLNPDDVQKILENCLEKDYSYKFLQAWLGNGLFVAPGILNNIRHLVKKIEETGTVNSVWIGPSLYVVTLNPDDVQKILENCLEKDYSYKFLQAWLGNGLFVAPVDLWKAHRRLLLPIFHNRIVEDYIEVFGEQGDVLVDKLREQVGKSPFDVYEYVTSCMLDIVFETAMGKRMDVQHNPDTPYLRARKTVMSIINMRLFKAWLQPDALFSLTSHATTQRESIDATHKFTDKVIQKKIADFEKLSYNDDRKDILQLLLERKLAFSNIELREHIDSITIAGNDTTALVISYALLLLGYHKHAQDKVHKELKSIFGDSQRSPTKEDLSKMDYLERVIKETMRLYTVVPIIGRKTVKELKLSTFTIPAGVGCAVIPMAMHRSKRLWGPDADSFDPDRFLPENCLARHPCAYIPFSYGSRNCIGRHFGMLAMKSILANVLRSYKVSSEACEQLKIEILLFPVHGHQITLENRL